MSPQVVEFDVVQLSGSRLSMVTARSYQFRRIRPHRAEGLCQLSPAGHASQPPPGTHMMPISDTEQSVFSPDTWTRSSGPLVPSM